MSSENEDVTGDGCMMELPNVSRETRTGGIGGIQSCNVTVEAIEDGDGREGEYGGAAVDVANDN